MDKVAQLETIIHMLEKQELVLSSQEEILKELRQTSWEAFGVCSPDEDSICSGTCFDRIADILNARRAAGNKMRKVYERNQHLLKMTKDPGNVLTAEQEEQIRSFWSRYEFAYKNDPEIQRYFSGISGRFDPCYIGFGLQNFWLNRYWNHITVALIRNKNFLDLIFPQARLPRVIIRNMWARYYTPDRKLITKQEAAGLVYAELQNPDTDRLIVKPDDGEEGKGIFFLDRKASLEEIHKVFEAMQEKFICQEVIKNHPSYAAPHPESLNTLRIATLFIRDKVRLVGVVWRMGVDKQVDNWAAGGIACGVSPDGICASYGEDHFGNRVTQHPGGFQFAGHQLYNCKAAVDEAFRLHYMLPQIRYISWDFAINEHGEPILIELNSCGNSEILEMNGFPCYIDQATLKNILDEYLIRRFYYDRANWVWDYREYCCHVVLTRYAGHAARVSIPAALRKKPVRGILANAFAGSKATELIVPETVFTACAQDFKVISEKYPISVTEA